MFRAYTPFLISLSKEVQEMLICPPAVTAATVFRRTAALGGGFAIDHVPVTNGDASCATSTRAMWWGAIVIEVDALPNGLSPLLVTGAAWREVVNTTATRQERAAQ